MSEGRSDTSTGVPSAIASSTTFGHPSEQREGSTTIIAAAIKRNVSAYDAPEEAHSIGGGTATGALAERVCERALTGDEQLGLERGIRGDRRVVRVEQALDVLHAFQAAGEEHVRARRRGAGASHGGADARRIDGVRHDARTPANLGRERRRLRQQRLRDGGHVVGAPQLVDHVAAARRRVDPLLGLAAAQREHEADVQQPRQALSVDSVDVKVMAVDDVDALQETEAGEDGDVQRIDDGAERAHRRRRIGLARHVQPQGGRPRSRLVTKRDRPHAVGDNRHLVSVPAHQLGEVVDGTLDASEVG